MSSFIVFKTYKDFGVLENTLMSLIVGFNSSNRVICFSNQYAALKCGVSLSSIKRVLSNFIKDGYIICENNKSGRIIHLLKEPILFEPIEDCLILNDLPMGQNEPPEVQNDPDTRFNLSHPRVNLNHPRVNLSHNSIDYNIENNIELVGRGKPYPPTFEKLVENYKQESINKEQVYEKWLTLTSTEQQMALDYLPNYFLYLENNTDKIKRELFYYLHDKPFNWNSVKYVKTKKKTTSREEQIQNLFK